MVSAAPGRGPVDYYLDPDEPPGLWTGGGRHTLGLDGTVEVPSCDRSSRLLTEHVEQLRSLDVENRPADP